MKLDIAHHDLDAQFSGAEGSPMAEIAGRPSICLSLLAQLSPSGIDG
jgi:hypothetical protein